MALVHGFLSPSECTHLIGRARDLLAPSVVARIEGGVENKRVSGSRTSSSCCLAAKDEPPLVVPSTHILSSLRRQ